MQRGETNKVYEGPIFKNGMIESTKVALSSSRLLLLLMMMLRPRSISVNGIIAAATVIFVYAAIAVAATAYQFVYADFAERCCCGAAFFSFLSTQKGLLAKSIGALTGRCCC